MNHIDWVILRRVGSRVGLAMLVLFGMLMLVESLDSWRFTYLSAVGGAPLAVLGIASAAATWLIKSLALTVLVGTVIGVIDLQSRRELTVIKSSGLSIWRILRAPTLAVLIGGFAIVLVGEGIVTQINRGLAANQPGDTASLSPSGGLWLEQSANGERYVIEAEHVIGKELQLADVTVFLTDGAQEGRILAPRANLVDGAWLLPIATRYRVELAPEHLTNFTMPTTTTHGDLVLKLRSTDDMTFFELAASLATKVSDPALRSAVATRFFRLLSLPALLVGALFIAFAFTAGYRRSSGYGAPIVYAIFLGFVVFVITEMADRAGSAGVLDPTLAACGPAFVAIMIGLTVLLYREDGRA